MRRHTGEESTRALMRLFHEKYPQIALRTTFIVGYPAETKADFKKLCDFVKEQRFDYAGFFPFYKEENTPSYFMKGQKSDFVKNRRLKKIQKIQSKIMTEKAKEKIGNVFKVLVDFFDENKGTYVGHTEFMSPTVDFGVEIVDNENVSVGKFVDVEFVDFDGENFKGEYYEPAK
jgi:ribosomal protein S12 methylthiotransferase